MFLDRAGPRRCAGIGLRAGTEALHDIAGFAEACRNLTPSLDQAPVVSSVMERFLSGLRALFPDAVEAVSSAHRVANTAMVRFPGIPNGVLMGVAGSARDPCIRWIRLRHGRGPAFPRLDGPRMDSRSGARSLAVQFGHHAP
ncbi:MAG: hypothetical protein IPN71_04425 [Fibrobacteres bacterium]|nr:hypothetical protein [Fibrobacterota bacterium]